MEHMIHEIKPVFNDKSRILILGSFPSVKSREGQFFYHHPQNRFWKVLAASLSQPVPATVEEKTLFLLSNHIAVWDVIASCDIRGSSDSSIRNVTPNDLTNLLSLAPIRSIYTNGGTSHKLFCKHIESSLGRSAVKLPSTSRPMRHGHWNVLSVCGDPPSAKVYFPEISDRRGYVRTGPDRRQPPTTV